MSPRVTPLLAVLALALGACTGAAATVTPSQPATPPAAVPPISATTPSPLPSPAATTSPDTGNVVVPSAPDLSIEPVGAQAIRVTLVNPDAKAWRVIVAGAGSRAADRWVLDVETGDVGPVITTAETAAGVDADPQEQPGLEMGDASGRVCSSTLPVCTLAKTVVLPQGGNGTLVLQLVRTDASVLLHVSAATAGWPTDPFVLGPWTTTEAFPWEA